MGIKSLHCAKQPSTELGLTTKHGGGKWSEGPLRGRKGTIGAWVACGGEYNTIRSIFATAPPDGNGFPPAGFRLRSRVEPGVEKSRLQKPKRGVRTVC